MSLELREGSCFHEVLVGVNVGLALVDGVLAVLAFSQVYNCIVFFFSFWNIGFGLSSFSLWLVGKFQNNASVDLDSVQG